MEYDLGVKRAGLLTHIRRRRLETLCSGEEARLKKLYTVWVCLYDILAKGEETELVVAGVGEEPVY